MIGIGIGLGFGSRNLGAGVGSSAVNTVLPTIDSVDYPRGAFSANQGIWTGATSIELRLESSADGISGWTDQGVLASAGTWATSLENLYVRSKATALPGSVVAYSAVRQLGPAYDQVLDPGGAGSYLTNTVSTPPFGASLTASTSGAVRGLWLSCMWYFTGSGYNGGLVLASLTKAVGGSNFDIDLVSAGGFWRNGSGPSSFTVNTAPAAAGWYITTMRLHSELGFADAGVTAYFDNATVVGPQISAANGTVLTNFDTYHELKGNGAEGIFPVAWIAAGRGDPAAAHAWAYNDGKKRRIDGYNFAGDANAAIDVFRLYARKSPGNTTFTVSESVDSLGFLPTPTLTGTLTWQNRIPGFIDPAGDPPATPVAFISPKFATTADTTLTIGINTKKIGDAVGGDLTISSLNHSIAGNIAGTVTGDTFPNPGAGTITGTINGVAVNCEIVTPAAMPTNPQFWTRYNENALVAAIEEYPTYGAGTTYGSIAALKAGIDALGAGATLTVENLTEAGTLTLTAKDYGGATVQCRFRHGVAINKIVMDGVRNLTLRGFSALASDITGGGMLAGTVTLDHCTSKRWYFTGTTGTNENFTVSNWIGPDDATAQSCGATRVNRYTLRRVAHGNLTSSGTGDVHRSDACNTIIAERVYFGETGNIDPQAHIDCWQSYGSGSSGKTEGMIINSVFIDKQNGGETASQGLFLTGINAQALRIKDVAVRATLANNLAVSAARQDVRIENTTSSSVTVITADSLSNSSLVDNNISGSAAGAILPSAGVGVETNTTNVAAATAFPDYATYAFSWRQWRNPSSGYETKGAHALITALEAKRLTL